MTSPTATFQFFSLLVLSAGLKTESIVEMRSDIMMEHNNVVPASNIDPESKTSPKSFSSKVKENFDAFEVALAVQMASQQRFAGFVQGSLLLVILAALGLYAISKQPGKKLKKEDCIADHAAHADIKPSPDPVPAEVPSPSPEDIEEELDMYAERQGANKDCDDDSAFLQQELNKMLDDNLEAEAEELMVCNAKEEVPSPSRADVETKEMIEQELDRYLECQHANKDLDADLSVLKSELNRMLDDSLDLNGLNKMLDDSLEAEAEAAMVIHDTDEEVDVSRVEKEIAEQFSEALGFAQVPAWME